MHIEISDTIQVPAQTVTTPWGPHTVPAYPLQQKWSFDLPATNETVVTEAPPAVAPGI